LNCISGQGDIAAAARFPTFELGKNRHRNQGGDRDANSGATGLWAYSQGQSNDSYARDSEGEEKQQNTGRTCSLVFRNRKGRREL